MTGGTSSASIHSLPAPPVVEVAALGPAAVTGFVSIDGASLYLGMGRRFVEELIATRKLPSYKFGRSRRVRLTDLEDWASARREP
jgi:excisionase family DNA binding protein